MVKDRANKRRHKHHGSQKNRTKDVYLECKREMGERYNMGYSTSEEEEDNEEEENLDE